MPIKGRSLIVSAPKSGKYEIIRFSSKPVNGQKLPTKKLDGGVSVAIIEQACLYKP
jgi:hypothetical protein